MDLKKSKRFTGIILKDGGCEAEDVYDVGDGLYLNKCEIEQLKKSLENTPKTMSKIVVLKTEGKGKEGVDFATVMLFDKTEDADLFIIMLLLLFCCCCVVVNFRNHKKIK